jgi:hypothetical protein
VKAKTIEIRDRATFIPALALKLDPVDERDRWLLARAGFGRTPEATATYTLLVHLTTLRIEYDWASWTNRTMKEAHRFVDKMFDELEPGEVVDVRYIVGETDRPVASEREETTT